MLKLEIPSREFFDDETSSFIQTEPTVLMFEHSLVSISKWEALWHIPFLGKNKLTDEHTKSYVKFMCLDEISDEVLDRLTNEDFSKINAYISDPYTATTLPELPSRGKSETITSELVYFWMVSMQIPFECQYWHFNRLLTLIKIYNIKNSKPNKSGASRAELARRRQELNAQRRAQLNSGG